MVYCIPMVSHGAPTDLKIEMVNTTYLNLLISGVESESS